MQICISYMLYENLYKVDFYRWFCVKNYFLSYFSKKSW